MAVQELSWHGKKTRIYDEGDVYAKRMLTLRCSNFSTGVSSAGKMKLWVNEYFIVEDNIGFKLLNMASPLFRNTIVSGRNPENGNMTDLEDAELIAQSITFMSDIESVAFKQNS